jgi:hypothetical protein
MVAVMAGFAAEAVAQPPARITALGDRLVVRRCAEPTCDVVAELPRGQAAQVLTTVNGWHRVLITLEGARATTGWVEAALSAPAAAAAPRTGQGASLPDRGNAPTVTDTGVSNCLTCVATRTPTTEEWNSAMKTLPAPAAPEPAAAVAAAPPAATPRAEVVRRDGRSTVERMRDEIDVRFGDELKRLGAVAAQADRDLQTYTGACYERYLPIQVLPPGPTPPGGTPPPVRPRATIFEMWRGRPAWAWNETWSTLAATTESVAFCQGLWNGVSGRAADVRAGLDRIEAEARTADIFPGVVRDALQAYGLSDGK